jgi:DNA primase
MIKQSSIDNLRTHIVIADVIGEFVKLKKLGANYSGCCPFHNEKTASFVVSPAKDLYKCFGCGKSGDAFTFIMQHENKSFPEAIEYIAAVYNITLDYDQQAQQQSQEIKDHYAQMQQVTRWAQERYAETLRNLPADAEAVQYLQGRAYDKERTESWNLGYAPGEWKTITTPLINMGKYQPALDCGLIQTKSGSNWDFFRHRIIIPIHDHNGVLVGLAGRSMPTTTREEAAVSEGPKYLNPPESLLYQKKKVWYGLWQAQKAIRETGFAYIVEGYFDVHAMHDAGIVNTIAPCGTGIDLTQLQFLKRYCSHLVLATDGDAAGQKAMLKTIDRCLQLDFKTQVLALPDAMDPDEYIRFINHQNIAA